MIAEYLTAIAAIVALIAGGLNAFSALRVGKSVSDLKVWSLEKFATKDDLRNSLAGISSARSVLQLRESRVREVGDTQ